MRWARDPSRGQCPPCVSLERGQVGGDDVVALREGAGVKGYLALEEFCGNGRAMGQALTAAALAAGSSARERVGTRGSERPCALVAMDGGGHAAPSGRVSHE